MNYRAMRTWRDCPGVVHCLLFDDPRPVLRNLAVHCVGCEVEIAWPRDGAKTDSRLTEDISIAQSAEDTGIR